MKMCPLYDIEPVVRPVGGLPIPLTHFSSQGY